jgi:hypothetical protein
MKAPTSRVPIPVVTKVRRPEWRIPRIDERVRHEKILREEAKLERLAQGTEPHGRELLRKKMYWVGKQLQDGVRGDIILQEVEREVRQFAMLREQWALLLSRIWNVSLARLVDASPTLFSAVLIAIVKFERDCELRRSASS